MDNSLDPNSLSYIPVFCLRYGQNLEPHPNFFGTVFGPVHIPYKHIALTFIEAKGIELVCDNFVVVIVI